MTATSMRIVAAPADVPLSETDDESLALRLKDGDDAASEELVRRYAQPLLRYLHRLSGSEHAAEELFQQTWLSVLEHVDRFNPSAGGGFRAWLYRIATNKANDLWRSRGREKNAKAGLKLVTDESFPDASHRMAGSEQEQKLKRALAQLPEPQRQVLLLRYYSELKFVEIAEMLGCPLNTALGRMHKAMQKLKQMME
ncbi:MAG TPA: sigma-70 family RNA polymerase sigma factor [Tepidisphaeraceae bacterium]|nr:sigma-70 family RNA polymerase sigma factor [Tepidisphaeraceae bacterium]